ncbi:unnamed protein product [Arabidopsis arenosa]|uniref:Zinc finger GRF-type domain-containing protein n=1 Tax=Arabidopsis arenosa TaxID=38785 RepID=A0A8S1ZU67_ARAAE|nr:unnamed protein product [Arabidopsis arenosa]
MSDSSSSTSPADRRDYGEYAYGISTHCFCGGRARLEPSRTTANPERLFYTCQNFNDGKCYIWKWWDEVMIEELTKLRIDVNGYPPLHKMRETLERHRHEILHIYDLHDENKMEFARLRAMIAKKSDGLSLELKNVFVAVFVLIAIIIYLFM